MSHHRLAEALGRLDQHHDLHLPLRRRDLLGRLALKVLWRRHLKWQIETNIAARDALTALRDALDDLEQAVRASRDELAERTTGLVSSDQLNAELATLHRSDQNIVAGTNQRLYSAVGQVQTQLSDLRVDLAERADTTTFDERIETLAAQVRGLATAARDERLRHARLDVFLDEIRATLPDRPDHRVAAAIPDRVAFLEQAITAMIDGPAEAVRDRLASHLQALRNSSAPGPVFDMSPGRGEWWEVLRTAGLSYRTASRNPSVRQRLADLGHVADDAEPLDALAAVPHGSCRAVTAFRWVERIDPTSLARFVDLAVAAIAPGGVLIVDTPAPTSSGRRRLDLDPFARRVVHPDFLRLLAEAAGFRSVEIHHTTTGDAPDWSATADTADQADRYRLTAWR